MNGLVKISGTKIQAGRPIMKHYDAVSIPGVHFRIDAYEVSPPTATARGVTSEGVTSQFQL